MNVCGTTRSVSLRLPAALLVGAGVASDAADGWSGRVRTRAALATVVGLSLLAGGSAMVYQAEHALYMGVVTCSRRVDGRQP